MDCSLVFTIIKHAFSKRAYFEFAKEAAVSYLKAVRIIDRYIFREWIKVFALTFGVAVSLLLLDDLFDNLPDLLSIGASFSEILTYYFILMPSFLPLVVPLAFMLSLVIVLGNAHKHNEITALKTAGLSLLRITRSLWVAGAILCGILFYANASWVPMALEESQKVLRRLKLNQENEYALFSKTPFAYITPNEKILWVAQSFQPDTSEVFHVHIEERTDQFNLSFQLMAEEGFFDAQKQIWIFLKGYQTKFDELGAPLWSLHFDRLEMPTYTTTPTAMEISGSLPRDLSLWQIERILADTSSKAERLRPYFVQYQNIWASPFLVLLVLCLAIPLSCRGVRINPMIGVAKCAGCFFLYMILHQVGIMFAEQGHLPIVAGVWLPTVFMLALSGKLALSKI